MLTIVKDELAKHIVVGPVSEDSPTALPGWKEWMGSVWKQATEPIPIVVAPKVERGEVNNFAQMFQPVRLAASTWTLRVSCSMDGFPQGSSTN